MAESFDALVRAIVDVHENLRFRAAKAVDVHLTLRNWLIGAYIFEYEQRGRDRAAYGTKLLESLSQRLRERGLSNTDERELRRFRQFYAVYPQIRETLSPEFAHPGSVLVQNLSFSHLSELIDIEDALKRAFYEVECLRGNWSVRELRRQLASLYYERVGLSKSKKKLSALTQARAEPQSATEIIRDPYVFEFLGLKSKEVMSESNLEDALLDKLQNFLLELGHGFCFEARQKRILIDGEHFFVDLGVDR